MFHVDLHTHTRFFHWNRGSPTPFDPVGASLLTSFASWRDLEGVAMTNHDYYRGYEPDDAVTPLPGIEVSSTRGHILVVGPDPPTGTTPGALTPEEVVTIAHERDCAAILAHPHRNSTVGDSGADLDAVEVNGKHPQHREKVERLADQLDLPVVGGSDAHYPFEVGRAYTEVEAEELTASSIVEAIRDGRVEAKLDDRLANRVVQSWYERIHASKGHA